MTRVVNRKLDNFEIYIGRGSAYGNMAASTKPNSFGIPLVKTKEEAIEAYRTWIISLSESERNALLYQIKDRVLGCYCAPKGGCSAMDKPYCCHGQVLAELADRLPDRSGKIFI